MHLCDSVFLFFIFLLEVFSLFIHYPSIITSPLCNFFMKIFFFFPYLQLLMTTIKEEIVHIYIYILREFSSWVDPNMNLQYICLGQ